MKKRLKAAHGNMDFEKTAVRVSMYSIAGNAVLTAFKLFAGIFAHSAAKAMLFRMCRRGVINDDDEWAGAMKEASVCPVYTFSAEKNEADLVAKSVELRPDGVTFCALTVGRLEKVRLGIPGMFSVYNALAALSAVMSVGVSVTDAADALCRCKGVKGRAEVVPTGEDFTVIIDYAHTPDALSNILDTVKMFARGRTVLLFGCGGDREKQKRPLMGAIAARKADYVYVTSDNPRTEEPMEIISEILGGMEGSGAHYEVIEDRREAIKRAVISAQPDDVIILSGKGHETYQIIGAEKHHFDEREIVSECLKMRRDAQL